jgi:hypothetical protein
LSCCNEVAGFERFTTRTLLCARAFVRGDRALASPRQARSLRKKKQLAEGRYEKSNSCLSSAAVSLSRSRVLVISQLSALNNETQ